MRLTPDRVKSHRAARLQSLRYGLKEITVTNDAVRQEADSTKAASIAAYLKANPSLELAIDGTPPTNGADPKNAGLDERRVSAVRFALIDAGVPAYKIRTGAYGDPQTRRDRRVEVLFATAK